jgi:replicative DNA helicase
VKTLLRGTFVARPDDDAALLYRNVQALTDAGLGFEVVEDNVIWTFIQNFVRQHHHVPDQTTVQDHFRRLREDEVADRLEALANLPVRTGGNYLQHLEERVEDHRTVQVSEILKESARIIETGITIREGKEDKILRGPADAVRYVLNRSHEIVAPSTGVRLSGDATADGESVKSEYERVESDPLAGLGQFCGINQIDERVKGAKRAELWTHAAFTGGLKSTFGVNWIYNQSVFYRHSGIFFSLEMPYVQVRRLLYAIHSYHDKFAKVRKSLGIGRCLDYVKVRDGMLDHYSDEEMDRMDPADRKRLLPDASGIRRVHPNRPQKRFLMDHVIPDFNNPANKYGKIHIEVADPDKTDFTVPDLRAKAELLFSSDRAISTIFVDHMGLMSPRRWSNSTTERLNEVLRDLKKLAMNFNRGMGIAVVGFFQISREGYKSAAKNDGRYNLTHLSYANEAERSSDIVTSTYVDDDLRARSQVRFQCLKSRDDQPFEMFYSGVWWACRCMYTTHDVTAADARQAGDQLDSLLDGM